MVQVKFSCPVNPNGYDTTAQFLTGETVDSFAEVGELINIPAGDEEVIATVTVELEEDSDYVVKLIATNEIGSVESSVTEFVTDVDGLPIVGEVTVEIL